MLQNRRIDTQRVLEKLNELFAVNDTAKALQHLHYWLSEAEAAKDDRAVLLFYNELMGLYRKLGEKARATEYAQKALAQTEKMNIGQNVGAATTYLNCATVYKAFERADDALSLYEKAREIYERELDGSDDRLAGLYNNTALALVDLACFDEADELYKKALAVLQENEGSEPEQAITYLNMASAAEAEHGLEAAQEKIDLCAQKATALLEKCREQTDGNYAFVCEKCAGVFGYYGYFIYAKQLNERSRRIYEGN